MLLLFSAITTRIKKKNGDLRNITLGLQRRKMNILRSKLHTQINNSKKKKNLCSEQKAKVIVSIIKKSYVHIYTKEQEENRY